MHTVSQLLGAKAQSAWTITPTATVYDALKLMAEKNIGALIVVEARRLVGVFSERDYARKVILMGKTSRETAVREIMSTHVISVTGDHSIGQCMELMTKHHIRHLPVLEGNTVVGMISIGDVVKAIIDEQEDTIHHLMGYIAGAR